MSKELEKYKMFYGWGFFWQRRVVIMGKSEVKLSLYSNEKLKVDKMARVAYVKNTGHFYGPGAGFQVGAAYGIAWNINTPDDLEKCGGWSPDWSLVGGPSYSGMLKNIAKGIGRAAFNKMSQEAAKGVAKKVAKESAKEAAEVFVKNHSSILARNRTPQMIVFPFTGGLEASLGLTQTSNKIIWCQYLPYSK